MFCLIFVNFSQSFHQIWRTKTHLIFRCKVPTSSLNLFSQSSFDCTFAFVVDVSVGLTGVVVIGVVDAGVIFGDEARVAEGLFGTVGGATVVVGVVDVWGVTGVGVGVTVVDRVVLGVVDAGLTGMTVVVLGIFGDVGVVVVVVDGVVDAGGDLTGVTVVVVVVDEGRGVRGGGVEGGAGRGLIANYVEC